jgi:3-oxoadipate enol-lactonase
VLLPLAERSGASIHYEVRGEGPVLVLLEGLGHGRWTWYRQVEDLSRFYRLLLVDNRGISPSTPLEGPYRVEEFARDTLAVLDQEGVSTAAILGVSLGGFIAQSVAAQQPDRVSALVLVSTSPGGPRARPMPMEIWRELNRTIPGETPRTRLDRTMRLAVSERFPETHREEWERLLDRRLAEPQSPEQWLFQASSSAGFDATPYARQLDKPVLIVVGTADRILPWTNSLWLYKLFPRASLLIFSGSHHLLHWERAEELDRQIRGFLGDLSRAAEEPFLEEVP